MLAYGEMQYAKALEMKYKRLIYSHSLAEEVVSQKQFMTALSSCGIHTHTHTDTHTHTHMTMA